MMMTWSDMDESIEGNFENEASLCLMANNSKVIDYYSTSENADVDVLEVFSVELKPATSSIKDLKK